MKKIFNKAAKTTSILMAAVISASLCVPMSVSAANVDGNSICEYADALVGDSYPNRRCLQFVEEVYQANGADRPYTCCALGSYDEYVVSASQEDIPIGVLFTFRIAEAVPQPAAEMIGMVMQVFTQVTVTLFMQLAGKSRKVL